MLDEAFKLLFRWLLLVSFDCKGSNTLLGYFLVETCQNIDEVDKALFCHILVCQFQGIGKVEVVPIVLAQVCCALLYAAQTVWQSRVWETVLSLGWG